MNARSRFSQSAIPNGHRMWPRQKDRSTQKKEEEKKKCF